MSFSRLRPRNAECTGLACSRSETTRPSLCLRSLRRQASSCRERFFRCNTSLTWHHRDRNVARWSSKRACQSVRKCRSPSVTAVATTTFAALNSEWAPSLSYKFNSDITDITTWGHRGYHVATAWLVQVGQLTTIDLRVRVQGPKCQKL